MRTDIPPRLFRELLLQASEVVQQRLLAAAKPETQAEIRRILAKVTHEVGVKAAPRNYAAALAAVRAMHGERKLEEADVVELRQCRHSYEETIAVACHALLGAGRRRRPPDGRRARRPGPDPLPRGRLRLADGEGDDDVAAGQRRPSGQALDDALANFERLSPATAQRVVRFWQVRPGHAASTDQSLPANIANTQGRDPRAWPWLRSASAKTRPRLAPIVGTLARSTRNPASAACASASRRHSPAISVAKRNSPPGRKNAREPPQTLSSCTKRRFQCRRFGQDRDRADRRARAKRAGASRADVAGVAVMQTDVGKFVLVDRRQRLGHAVDERLAADEAAAGIRRACAIRCSPPPKPISSRTSSTASETACADRLARRCRDRARARGSSVSNSAACRGCSGWPLRRPKNARDASSPCGSSMPSVRMIRNPGSLRP